MTPEHLRAHRRALMFCVKCGVNVNASGSECPRCHFDTLVRARHPEVHPQQ